MRFFKRTIAVAVAFAMLCSCFAFTSLATGETASIDVSLSETQLAPGDIVTVTVSIANNFNAITMRWPVLYSANIFELVGADGNVAYPINTKTLGTIIGSADYSTAADFLPAAYSSTDYGVFTVQWVAKGRTSPSNLVGAYNQAASQACFTFQLKVKAGASGTGSVFIPGDSTDFYYTGITDPTDALTAYTSQTPFAYNFTSASATVEAAVLTPEIVAAEGSSVQLKTFSINGTPKTVLCGFDLAGKMAGTIESYENEFTVSNGGTYTLSTETIGTGTVVNLVDSQGTAAGSYEVVIFGDTNGDGMLDVSDISQICQLLAGDLTLEATDAAVIATDVSPNAFLLDVSDVSRCKQAVGGDIDFSDIDQLHTEETA